MRRVFSESFLDFHIEAIPFGSRASQRDVLFKRTQADLADSS